MTYNFSEKEMVVAFCKILEEKNINFAVEVPFYNRSIDLVYYDEQGNINAVEFKLHNWKKAINQARDCAIGAHFIYICIPEKNYTPKIIDEIEKADCGLIIFDPKKKETKVIKKGISKNFWNGANNLLKKGFEYSVENNNYQQLMTI